MGATCVKDKTATPRQANNGAERAARAAGRGGAQQQGVTGNAAGRPAARAANEKVAEKQFGHCGVVRDNNHNNGKPAGGGGGISAYRPSDDIAKLYFEQINELRAVAIASGVLPALEGSCTVDSTKNNDGTSFAESRRASDYPITACPPLTTLTVYQCQPLVGDSVVAKGMYSSVHLARLSVFSGTSEATANAATPRQPVGRKTSNGSSIVFSPDPLSTEASDSISVSFVSGTAANGSPLSLPAGTGAISHYIIAMKEMPMYASYSSSVLLEQIRVEVRNWTRLSAYTSRVLRCYALEYIYAEGVSAAVPEACCHFYPGHSNDEVRAAKATNVSPHSSPIGKILERRKSPSGSTSPKLFGSIGRGGRATSSPDTMQVDPSSSLQKLRLYLEYAKYGTLRGYQSKDMPERFDKRRLHELTARAYMRDVLLALLQVHECGELQFDLCAKSIFLNRHVHTVYGTYFPAYISDVPSGDLTSVTPSQLGRALGQLDPPMPLPSSPNMNVNKKDSKKNVINVCGGPAKKAGASPYTGGNEPISGVTGSPSGQMTSSAVNLQGDLSVVTHDASMAHAVSTSDARINNKGSTVNNTCVPLLNVYEPQDEAGSTNEAYDASPNDGHGSASLSSVATPLRVDHPLSSPKKGFSGLGIMTKEASVTSIRTTGYAEADDVADYQRLNEVYCRYMDDFDFKRNDGDDVPFPSPHDGIRAQVDAELMATTMLPELPRATPAMRVVPLQRSALGGVALVSPDHHLVKPGDALHAPDLRGRLPMVLTSATDTNALVCGSPHTTAPTFSPTPASQGSPSGPALASAPPVHTMSSGLTMADAAGSLGRARGGVPLTKLNHASLIRRALAYGDADKLEDIPVCKYVTVTHAAPEVLHRRAFSTASDIYAFAMTFIELVTDDGNIMEDCLPQNLAKPKTRREKEEYDAVLTTNLDKWYQTRLVALRQHYDAVAKEQQLPALLSPRAGPVVVRVPEHLSDEARNMLRWCLQSDPQKRPSAAELLRSRYFMLGDWIAAPSVVATEQGVTKPPEKPWDTSVSFDAAAKAIGLPTLPG